MLNSRGDTQMLHPVCRPAFERLQGRLNAFYKQPKGTTTWWRIFETYRSPTRQQELLDQSAQGRVVTKAKPWESPHQLGLAADFAAMEYSPTSSAPGRWSWDSSLDWGFIAKIVETEFSDELYMPLPEWDRGHVVHYAWLDWKTVTNAYQ